MFARDLLVKELRFGNGDGKSFNIWDDSWISFNTTRKVSSRKPIGCNIITVDQLIHNFKCNQDLLRQIFIEVVANLI
ncbi:hypothetical protein ACH5RR_029686, partial [Cinchona calisaya]